MIVDLVLVKQELNHKKMMAFYLFEDKPGVFGR